MKKIIFIVLFVIQTGFSQSGILDASFNPGTAATKSFYAPAINDAVLQPDGKIIIGGYFDKYQGVTSNCIARINPDGSFDSSFNTGSGFDFSTEYYDPHRVKEMALQPDGKIIVAGDFYRYNGVVRESILRLNTDGSLDTSFTFPASTPHGYSFTSIIIQSDGKIVLGCDFNYYYLTGASTSTTCYYLLRLNPDGSIDNTFNIGIGLNGSPSKMILQPDNKILVSGSFELFNNVWTPTLVRLNEDGTRDTSFQIGNGFANGSPNNGNVYDIDLLPDQSMYLTGDFQTFDGQACGKIVKLLPNGNRDWSFNINGSINLNFYGYGARTTVQQNGKLVICSGGTNNGAYIWHVLRLNIDGTYDTTFNTSGTGFSDSAYFSLLQADGKLLFFGPFLAYNGVAIKNIARLTGDLLSTDRSTKNQLVIYPNPVNSQLNINTPENVTIDKIRISDVLGKEVLMQSENTSQINTENLAKGLYFIQAFSGKNQYTAKFIKE